ncbi:hypothetical protein TRFO_32439 [Tritrichomonas foetus]|uniref:Cache domain-containing protein n=1 Tax=Tritrichomonas foetus TaxID=1144522 RepID=A0A1J4JTD1_9EUKA|nr:hypothetical protein TRFO_32439 [Tritrichomonas foetus]|eukprot:OHT00756.1 hypothetical protein TRFO_32439 [Tritrichomonas foetus]
MSQVMLSCLGQTDRKADANDELIEAKRMQTSVFSNFTAKRGAGRIERYFVKLRTRQITWAINITCVSLVIIILILFIWLAENTIQKIYVETTDDMIDSTRAHVYYITKNLFLESIYFSVIMSQLLSYPKLFDFYGNDMKDMIQLLLRAYDSVSLHVCHAHDFGGTDRKIISVEYNLSKNEKYLSIVNATINERDHRCSWKIDDKGYNSSYPKNGDCSTFSTASYLKPWFQYGYNLNRSTWSDFFFGENSYSAPPYLSAVSPAYDDKGEIVGVLSSSIELDALKTIFESLMPAKSSRFAVLTEHGIIATITGVESAYGIYKGEIITKTLEEIQDPIWSILSPLMKIYPNTNFTAAFNFEDHTFAYSVTIHNITVSPGVQWQFVSCICTPEIFDMILKHQNSIYYLTFVFIVSGFGVIVVFEWAIDYFINIEKNRLLSTKKGKSLKHVREVGIVSALNILKKLTRSHADNIIVKHLVKDVVDEIQCEQESIYFSTQRFYSSISNKKVVEKFASLYGYDSESIPNYEISSIWSRRAKNFSGANESSSFSSIGFDLSGAEQQVFHRRKTTLSLTKDQVIEMTKAIFHQYNTGLFNYDDLDTIIEGLINKIGDEMAPFCADAIELNLIILQWRVQEMLYSSDYAYSLMIATIIYQVSERKRWKPNRPLINRYLITDRVKLDKVATMVLSTLYQAVDDEDQFERWNQIVEIVMKILDVATVENHSKVIQRIILMSNSFPSIKQRNKAESLALVRILFITSIVSPAFHDIETSLKSRTIIHPDIQPNKKIFINFQNCFKSVLLVPLMRSLGLICGTKFVLKFCEK